MIQDLTYLLSDIGRFCRLHNIRLRHYQQEIISPILQAVLHNLGGRFVVCLPRQSGKNEIQASLSAYLLLLLSQKQPGADLLQISPTWRPQGILSRHRAERLLRANPLTRHIWRKIGSNVLSIGSARITYLSAAKTSSIVGHTASHLMIIDEAQDIDIQKFDKDLAPMCAATNAVIVLFGTAWTTGTLLARERRSAPPERKWSMSYTDIGREVPTYLHYVEDEIRRHGRESWLTKSQYLGLEIPEEGRLFAAPEKLTPLRGSHSREISPRKGSAYIIAIDVGGSDLASETTNEHDPTAITIARVVTQNDLNTYEIVLYHLIQDANTLSLQSQLAPLVNHWSPVAIIVDATGVGAGLANWLQNQFPQTIPFTFTYQTKSALGWALLDAIETRRLLLYTPLETLANMFLQQLQQCVFAPQPNKLLRWHVPRTQDNDGNMQHDDLLISTALLLHYTRPAPTSESAIIQPTDPISAANCSSFV